MKTINITLHVDVRTEQDAIEVSEQLSRQATGFALRGFNSMVSIDTHEFADDRED